MRLYCVKDVKVGFMSPVPALTDGQVSRMFAASINSGSDIGAYPDDMELWYVADFDEASGLVFPRDLRCVVRGSDVKGVTYERLAPQEPVSSDLS